MGNEHSHGEKTWMQPQAVRRSGTSLRSLLAAGAERRRRDRSRCRGRRGSLTAALPQTSGPAARANPLRGPAGSRGDARSPTGDARWPSRGCPLAQPGMPARQPGMPARPAGDARSPSRGCPLAQPGMPARPAGPPARGAPPAAAPGSAAAAHPAEGLPPRSPAASSGPQGQPPLAPPVRPRRVPAPPPRGCLTSAGTREMRSGPRRLAALTEPSPPGEQRDAPLTEGLLPVAAPSRAEPSRPPMRQDRRRRLNMLSHAFAPTPELPCQYQHRQHPLYECKHTRTPKTPGPHRAPHAGPLGAQPAAPEGREQRGAPAAGHGHPAAWPGPCPLHKVTAGGTAPAQPPLRVRCSRGSPGRHCWRSPRRWRGARRAGPAGTGSAASAVTSARGAGPPQPRPLRV
ncbi:basic salivary proline-rich protein 1-like [Poecile atricapillus]|uniref:basic salivary proline-rich protein 1-like n=1 Tax=Poecile atricapillus TaxID=48891 RepID=UPI0027381B54|nr:basic salivary proline-rich protein 1-like [Poecile atricapillus]